MSTIPVLRDSDGLQNLLDDTDAARNEALLAESTATSARDDALSARDTAVNSIAATGGVDYVVTSITERDNLSPSSGEVALVLSGNTGEFYEWDGSAWNQRGPTLRDISLGPTTVSQLSDLRSTSSNSTGEIVQVSSDDGGLFVLKASDPFGFGDDGAVVLQASDGTWWVRKEAIGTNTVTPKWWGLKDGTTDEQTTTIQKAIEWLYDQGKRGTVHLPPGTYYARNLLLRDGISLIGAGVGQTTLKMYNVEETRLKSTNGTVTPGTRQDSNGEYPSNLISNRLRWNGGVVTKSADRSRARDPNNTDWDGTDIEVAHMTLDHRFAVVNGNYPTDKNGNATSSEDGFNNAAMGGCVQLVNVGHSSIHDVVVKNARLDGIFTGFDENGGFDNGEAYNIRVKDCLRTGVAAICGRNSTFQNGTVTGGADVGSFDLEPNLDGTITSNNEIIGWTVDKDIKLVSRKNSNMYNNTVRNCVARSAAISEPRVTQGTKIESCVFRIPEGDNYNGSALFVGGVGQFTGTNAVDIKPLVFEDVETKGDYNPVVGTPDSAILNVHYRNCRFEGQNMGRFLSPYDVKFSNCKFELTDEEQALRFVFANKTSIPTQGEIEVRGCVFSGSISTHYVAIVFGNDPPSLPAKNLNILFNRAEGASAANPVLLGTEATEIGNSWNLRKTVDNLKDNTGGTASDTVETVSGTGDDATLNDNIASLRLKIKEIQSVLEGNSITKKP